MDYRKSIFTFCYFTLILVLCFLNTIPVHGEELPGENPVRNEVNEDPIQRTYYYQPGNREYLSPNIRGLQNLAISFLPETHKFLNVIEAFREVTDTVRYDLLARTENANNNNEEIICHLVIKEVYWWVEEDNRANKIRVLDYSNCSSEHKESVVGPSRYFEPKPDNVNGDLLSYIESQILYSNNNNNNGRHYHENNHNEQPNKPDNNERYGFPANFPSSTPSSSPPQRIPNPEEENREGLSENAAGFLDNLFSVNTAPLSVKPLNAANEENVDNRPLDDGKFDRESQRNEYQIERDVRKKRSLEKDCDESSESKSSNSEDCKDKYTLKTNKYGKSAKLIDVRSKEEHLFNKYKGKYNKIYSSVLEERLRFQIFKDNLRKIDELNKNEQGTAKYGITEFVDMTPAEYQQRTGLNMRDSSENEIGNIEAEIPDFKLPRQFDWRKKGVISSVKDQGSCGSCWAFSVTGNIEGLHAIKTGNLEEYSEQELLDCDSKDSACNGGMMDDAYKAIEEIGGLELESEYPYKARKGKCNFNKTMAHVKVKGSVDLPKNETAMALWLVANGPISIGINANAMQFYRGGISHPWSILCRKNGMDHGVLIVGFGVSEYPLFNKTLPYWIVKNSWGKRWGEQGYYRIYRGDNSCGIASYATSAVLF